MRALSTHRTAFSCWTNSQFVAAVTIIQCSDCISKTVYCSPAKSQNFSISSLLPVPRHAIVSSGLVWSGSVCSPFLMEQAFSICTIGQYFFEAIFLKRMLATPCVLVSCMNIWIVWCDCWSVLWYVSYTYKRKILVTSASSESYLLLGSFQKRAAPNYAILDPGGNLA